MAKSSSNPKIPEAKWNHSGLHGDHKGLKEPVGKLVTPQGSGKGLTPSPKVGSYDGGPKEGRGW